jgi:hypothetical protein
MSASHSDHAHADHAGHAHLHADPHTHGPDSPHPAQSPPWSILRMTLWGRLAVALALSAGLWAAVLVAMR